MSHVRPSVRVVGEAVVRTEPDDGELSITLTHVGPSPGPALAEVARRSARLLELLDELGVPAAARSTSGVGVQEEFDYRSEGRHSLGHRASATLLVRMTDVELIGRVIMRAGEELDASIAGPHWSVSPGHPAWLQVATQAAANAVEKAAAYAAGVNMRRGALVKLSEPRQAVMGRPVAIARRSSAGPEMPVEGGEHAVTASVEATFALEPGE
jgi:uncharacterized protein YggE